MHNKSKSQIKLNGEKLKVTPLTPGTRQAYPISPYLFNTALEVLSRTKRQLKDIKGTQIRKEELKISLFADDIGYIIDLKFSIREHLQLINTFSKVAGYKKVSSCPICK